MYKKSDHQVLVEKFMRLAGQEVPSKINIPDQKVRRLRAKLILEEALETIQALGFDFEFVASEKDDCVYLDVAKESTFEVDLEKVIDGCCDLKVVTTGTLSAFGAPDEIFQTEVDLNNLMKFGEGSYVDDNGKLIKPRNHKPPRINDLIKVMQNNGDMVNVSSE